MYVIEVTPLENTSLGTLTYFSGEAYPLGTILSIPIRSRLARGIVVSVTEATRTKTALRAATFSLRKLPPQDTTSTLPASLVKTAEDLSLQYAASLGSVLFSLLPNEIKKGTLPLPSTSDTHTEGRFEEKILEDTKEHRFTEYQSLIRETFALNRSVHIVAPSAVDIDIIAAELTPGITGHVITLKSGLSKKHLREAHEVLEDYSHPKLIITTPQYGFVARNDIRTTILERARAGGYRAQKRPYLDYREAYRHFSRAHGRMLIYGDTVLRSEEIYRLNEELAEPYGELPKRLVLKGKIETLLMVHKPDSTEPFKLFSDKLLSALDTTIGSKGAAFLFAARRGLAPLVACVDCGHILRAPDSGAPLSLHRTTKNGVEERWLVCSVSGHRERARDLCPQCGSWRLKERGIGIQQIYDSLKEHVDPNRITLFDHSTATTHARAKELVEEFYTRKGSVLLGTALALPYIDAPVSMSAVTSMDALRAIPSWRQQEEIFSILTSLREKTNGTVLVQTRTTDTDAFDLIEKGRVIDFHSEELAAREQFNYPPYAVFIHFTWQGTRSAVKEVDEELLRRFEQFNISIYASLGSEHAPADATHMQHQALIRVPKNDWPHSDIVEHIRALPPQIRVMINPDRIV